MAYGLGMTRLIDTSLKTALWLGHVEGKTCTVWPWRCRARFLYMRGTEKYLRKKIIIIINGLFFSKFILSQNHSYHGILAHIVQNEYPVYAI